MLKVCDEEIDKQFPYGWELPCNYGISCERSNKNQHNESDDLTGVEVIRWILYADDLVLFCRQVNEAQKQLK